ncbi:MAG: hypothetical protein H0V24_10165 [Chloroflexia bacterium]|nr:hypothetical protein [Chloroflexia bacterium]
MPGPAKVTPSSRPAGTGARGSPAPVLIILVVTVVVMIAGVLVILFPEQTGVPGLNATPPSQIETPVTGD